MRQTDENKNIIIPCNLKDEKKKWYSNEVISSPLLTKHISHPTFVSHMKYHKNRVIIIFLINLIFYGPLCGKAACGMLPHRSSHSSRPHRK